jgi:import inner membrane translocase subunit TIM23
MALSPLRPHLLKPLLAQQVRPSSSQAATAIPTWNEYFELRKKRRIYEVASYLPSTVIPAAGTLSYFLQMEIDPTSTILGLDPLMGSVALTAAAVSSFFFFAYERTRELKTQFI